MESERHPSSLPTVFSHQHDFSSLVLWPHNWQPESVEITTNNIPTMTSTMTPVVPEHMAHTKLASGINNFRKENSSSRKSRQQRSNSATLSTISVTCDTDTPTRLLHTRPQQSPVTQNTTTNLTTSVLTNVSINSPSAFNNHQQDKTSMSTLSEMNIPHEKSNIASSASTMSIPNKHLIKATTTDAGGGRLISTKSLSIKHKSTSFDDHRSTREVGKSVLEQLVFVFPENVRRILAGSKK